MILPTTLDSAERIMETIQDIKDKIPSDPYEADIILMADMVAQEDGQGAEKKPVSHGGEEEVQRGLGQFILFSMCFLMQMRGDVNQGLAVCA